MSIYKIQDAQGRNIGTVNKADSEIQAIGLFINDRCKPVWCRLHDEMPADRRSGEAGEMGWYQPMIPHPAKAVLMREIYMGGGYCIVPA